MTFNMSSFQFDGFVENPLSTAIAVCVLCAHHMHTHVTTQMCKLQGNFLKSVLSFCWVLRSISGLAASAFVFWAISLAPGLTDWLIFFSLKIFIFYLCTSVLSCLSLCVPHVCSACGGQKRAQCRCWETTMGPLQEYQRLLIPEINP